MAVIYLITNNLNNKRYVGYTKHNADYRFKQHCIESRSAAVSSILHEAIGKYGTINFRVDVLESSDDGDYLHKEREKFWINKMETMVPNGYNIQEGGEGNTNPKSRRSCELYNGLMEHIKSFESITDLSLYLGIPHPRVYIACKNAQQHKSSSILKKQYYVCFTGDVPHQKDTSYLVEHNKRVAAGNVGKKRPAHSEFMNRFNKQHRT